MNAKNILKSIEKHAADARRCYPVDHEMRAMYFAHALGKELVRCGEPAGTALVELMDYETNAPSAQTAMS